MLPKVVVHKRNGHSHAPAPNMSVGAMIRELHSVIPRGPAPNASLLRFASLVSTERWAALLSQAGRRIDGVEAALTAALASTEAKLDGEAFADVRTRLEALRAHVDLATRLVGGVVGDAESGARTADVNGLLTEAVRVLDRRDDVRPTLVMHLAEALPGVAGHPRQLGRALYSLLARAWEAGPPRASTVTVETGLALSPLRGEPIVRIRIVDDGPTTTPEALQALLGTGADGDAVLAAAVRTVAEHGGTIGVDAPLDGHVAITVDLPAL